MEPKQTRKCRSLGKKKNIYGKKKASENQDERRCKQKRWEGKRGEVPLLKSCTFSTTEPRRVMTQQSLGAVMRGLMCACMIY